MNTTQSIDYVLNRLRDPIICSRLDLPVNGSSQSKLRILRYRLLEMLNADDASNQCQIVGGVYLGARFHYYLIHGQWPEMMT